MLEALFLYRVMCLSRRSPAWTRLAAHPRGHFAPQTRTIASAPLVASGCPGHFHRLPDSTSAPTPIILGIQLSDANLRLT